MATVKNLIFQIFLYLIGNTIRKSKNTLNYYTILFSEVLSSWNKMPRRDKGLICSTYLSKAERYGKVFVVVPFDSTPIRKYSDKKIFEILILIIMI